MPETLAGPYAFSAYALPVALTATLMIAFGVTILVRERTRVAIALSGLTFFAGLWLAAFTLMYLSADAALALRWARLAYLGVPFLPAAIYHFSVEILRISDRRRSMVRTAWIGSAVFSLMAVSTDALVSGVQRYSWGYYPRYAAAASIPFLAFFFGYIIAALVEFVRAYPTAMGVERKRIRLLIIGFAIAYLGCVDYLPKYGIDVYPFGYLPLLAFVVIVFETMRRYELLALTPQFAAREIISTMADPLFVCDAERHIQFVNEAAEALTGFSRDELTGRPIDDVVEPRDATNPFAEGDEYAVVTRDGTRIEVTLSIAPIRHQGEPAGSVIIGRDMRDQKRSAREVQRAVTLLQSTLDSTADGILVVGEGGKIMRYNHRFLDMWQIPPELMVGHNDGRLIAHVKDQLVDPEQFVRVVETLYSKPEGESFDLLEFKDGRHFERYSIGRAVQGLAGIRVWSFRDVTARFRAESAVRESESRYRLLFEQNAAGVCVIGADGRITDCNPTFATITGRRDRTELKNIEMSELFAHPVEWVELMRLLDEKSTLSGVEIEFRSESGKPVWVLQNLTRVGNDVDAMVHITVVDISDRKRAEEQIEFHAYHDVLTNLPNRKLFSDRLLQILTHARRTSSPVAVMFIDLDQFKTVNDQLGHTAGDELLLEMARRLRRTVREEDTVARLGGDEFTIILNELRIAEDAVTVAQKILAAIQAPITIGGMPLEVTASIGVALYPVDGHDPDTLLRNADSAMYRAKEAGRNNYQLCTDEMKVRAVQRLSLEAKLRRAIANEELSLVYQPQVNLKTGRMVGVEALLRWRDRDKGHISPAEFIRIAEESRLIVPMGQWVLERSCRQMKEWHDRGLNGLRIAVNLSARQFQQQDLVRNIEAILTSTGLDPAALELEITETTAMHNAEATTDVLRDLREIGVGISIDDFGTGYSSLNYLKRFPINAIKIDRAFVSDLEKDAGDTAIVSAVLGIARSLQLRVVAEGVETSDQFAFLRRNGCDEAQGFYFSHPVPAEELEKLPISVSHFKRPARLTV